VRINPISYQPFDKNEIALAFSVLAKDIASSPGQWLSNLGSGAQDGVRNHLWGAFKTATQEWFNQKVEGVLGLGMPVWKVLNQGGIKTAEVGKMAWEGIKSAIPPALIQILIEKVISMIVPAAGAVLAIIEGLQVAWGTVSRVIQAFDRFMGFLKAVKTGQSGPQFGAALAAAGVVLIDFVSNWLLKRVRGATSKVAAKVKEIAKKIGRKLKAASKKLGRKFGKVKDKFKGKKGKKGQKDAKRSHEEKSKDKDNKEKDDIAKKPNERTKQEKEADVHKAVVEANKILEEKDASPNSVKAKLPGIQSKYKLTSIELVKGADTKYCVTARINPTGTTPGHTLGGGSFKLAPGGIQAHEGHKILTSSGKEKEIHLIAKHGPDVLEADMKDRLENMKQLFEDMRNDKIAKQQARITAAQAKINEFNTSQSPTNPQKIAERQNRILGLNQTITEVTSLITEYQSINKDDRNAVFEFLDKWKPKSMPTYRVTKFSNLKRMERVITVALGRKQAEIDAAFIDSSGNTKTNGTSKIISNTITGMNLGVGYELDPNMQVIPISTPLQTVVLSLVISNPFEYMVETAYLEP
jgi:hypothetical protein